MRSARISRILLTLFALPAALLVFMGCDEYGDLIFGGGDEPEVQITVILENKEPALLGENIHLFHKALETFPCCQVAPQLSRTKNYTMRRGDHVTYQAGRNGEILTEKECTCNTACPAETGGPVGTPRVQWNGSTLTCVGW